MPSTRDPRQTQQQRRRRKKHASTSSQSQLISPAQDYDDDSPRQNRRSRRPPSSDYDERQATHTSSSGQVLSGDSLAALDAMNAKMGWTATSRPKRLRDDEVPVPTPERRTERRRSSAHDEDREREGQAERRRRRDERRRRRRERDEEERRRSRYVEQEEEVEVESRDVDYIEQQERRREERRRAREMYYSDSQPSPTKHRERRRERERPRYPDLEKEDYDDEHVEEERRRRRRRRTSDRQERRVVSGGTLERGGTVRRKWMFWRRENRAGSEVREEKVDRYLDPEEVARRKKKRLRIFIALAVIGVLLAIIVGVIVVEEKKKSSNSSNGSSSSSGSGGRPANSNLGGISPSSIPAAYKGTYYDPFSWYDTVDFNLTFTTETVGGLPIMGLNSSWDDNTQANPNVPKLSDKYQYGSMPIRGMNVGGWLSIEPFITPSLFSGYSTHDNVIDEWTLTSTLGSNALATIEPHYSSFITEQDFAAIQAAGFDHVRIPYSYWAVTTYDGDPYINMTSWRYLLRGIEYCRKYGLRVNLDLHGLPGSQNGWNHSGRQGFIGWLNGTDGDLNGQRSLDIHSMLSTFFAQPRYQNIISMYGLANEPRMVDLDTQTVLDWTTQATNLVRGNGMNNTLIVIGDGFLGLPNWQGKLQNLPGLVLDAHQYVIFNTQQITLDHSNKTNFACGGWTSQMEGSMDKSTGFGPTICGEWSQADTDCATYLNNVGVGSRWEGTLNLGNASMDCLTPTCPTHNNPQCECADANAAGSAYSSVYKQWLMQFAEAQMSSFEKGWGWFYWTWNTENSIQWSWKLGMQAGILPANQGQRSFNCGSIPDYASMGLPEQY